METLTAMVIGICAHMIVANRPAGFTTWMIVVAWWCRAAALVSLILIILTATA